MPYSPVPLCLDQAVPSQPRLRGVGGMERLRVVRELPVVSNRLVNIVREPKQRATGGENRDLSTEARSFWPMIALHLRYSRAESLS